VDPSGGSLFMLVTDYIRRNASCMKRAVLNAASDEEAVFRSRRNDMLQTSSSVFVVHKPNGSRGNGITSLERTAAAGSKSELSEATTIHIWVAGGSRRNYNRSWRWS